MWGPIQEFNAFPISFVVIRATSSITSNHVKLIFLQQPWLAKFGLGITTNEIIFGGGHGIRFRQNVFD